MRRAVEVLLFKSFVLLCNWGFLTLIITQRSGDDNVGCCRRGESFTLTKGRSRLQGRSIQSTSRWGEHFVWIFDEICLFVGKGLERRFWCWGAGEYSERRKGAERFSNLESVAGFKLIILPSCEILLSFEFLRRDNTVISWSLPPAGTADMSGDHCFLAQVIKFTLSVVSSVVLSVYKSKMAPSDPIPRRWEFVYKTVTRDGCVQGRSGKPLLWLDCNGHGKHCTSPSWPGAGRSFWACLFPISSTMSSLRNHRWIHIHCSV